MSNNSSSGSFGMWLIVGGILLLAFIGSLNNSGSSSSYSPAASSPAPNTFEYRYARERFRQEGFNAADSDTAARAVVKFHEAQQRRKAQ